MARTSSRTVKGIDSRIAELVKNMTFAELGALTACNAETARRYVNGGSVPSLDFLVRLAQTTGVSISWLVTGHGPRDEQTIREQAVQSLSLKELLLIIADRVGRLEESQAPRHAEPSLPAADVSPIIKGVSTESIAASTPSGLRLANGEGGETKPRRRRPRSRNDLVAANGAPVGGEAVPRAETNSEPTSAITVGQSDARSHRLGA